MTKSPTRFAQPRAMALLSRILDQPELVRSVQKLEPRTFGKLIAHIGLEDAGELVALATTEQLRRIFDDDLWRSAQPGRDETFDSARFTVWLEVMLEVGEEFAARKLTELSEDLVTLALNRHLLVLDIDALAVQMADRSDDQSQQIEKHLSSALSHEFDSYQVLAKREEGWDAILGVLVALDAKHHDFLHRVLERCCYASSEILEDNGGLYDALTAEEMLESDAAAEREDRRAGEGYVAPSSAVSFLALARQTSLSELENATAQDPLTRAYFRGYRPGEVAKQRATKESNKAVQSPMPEAGIAPAAQPELDPLLRVLNDFEVLEPARPLPMLSDGGVSNDTQLFKQALMALFDRDPRLHALRMQELSYLANVLIAGCSAEGKSFRPFEAAEAAVAVCNLGCEQLLTRAARGVTAVDVILKSGADKLFRIGWHLLHRDVVLVTARTVEKLIARRLSEVTDRAGAAAIGRLDRDLKRALSLGKPWTVRAKLAALDELLTERVRTTLQALLDECPRLADRSAISEAETSAATEFISTARQLREAAEVLTAL